MLQTFILRVLCVTGTISGARAPRSEPGALTYMLHDIGWATQSLSSPFINMVTHSNRNVGVSHFWELMEQGHASLQELSGRSVPCLFQLLVAPGILWLTNASLQSLSVFTSSSLVDPVCPFLSHKVTLIGVYVCVLVTQSCPTLCDPIDCISPGSSVHDFSRQEDW